MPSKRRLARQGSAVVLSSFLVATSLRVAADKPSAERLAKTWRDRHPRRFQELLRGGGVTLQEAREQWLEENGGVPPWRRGRRGGATPWAERLDRRFHAGGLAPVDPEPVNPLLDPLGLFEDEAGEEPPLGGLPRIFLADFDGDGDLDVFAGDKYGYVRYLENVGSATDPVYEERTGAASPTGSLDLSCDDEDPMETFPCGPSAPALADLDGDGDLDLFVGQGYYAASGGRVLFFENDGSGNLTRNDTDNPFDGFVFGTGYATPTFVDIDGDDDLDAFVGTKLESVPPSDGEVFFLRNDGDDQNPVFSDQSDTPEDPFAGEGFAPFTAPYFADIDGDGDLDAFIGTGYKTRHFRNDTVVPGTPIFTEQTGYDDPLGGGIMFLPGPVLADVDGDGDLDAFVGMTKNSEYDIGYVQFFENTGTPTDPGFLAPGDRLELVDVDGDGDLDALVSHIDAYLYSPVPEVRVKATGTASPPFAVWYFENVGTEAEPSWQLRTGLDNPFCTFNESYLPSGSAYLFPSLAPTVGDLDGDGSLDAFVGLPDGTLEFLEDDGTGQLDPAATHPLEAIDFGDSADPQLVDVNGDGDLDLVVGYDYYDDVTENYYARVAFFLNPDGPPGPDAPPELVLDFSDSLYRPAPVVADLDGDGDLDLLVGGYSSEYLSQTLFLENTGTPGALAFDVSSAQQVQALVTPPNSPAVGDVNGDGALDVFLGNLAGAELFVTEAPALEVTKEITGGDRQPGGTVEYTIVITNVGTATQPDDADDPELTDTLPPELTLVSALVTSGPGSVTTSGNTVRYDGAIEPGQSVTIVVQATIPVAAAGTSVENQAVAFYDADNDGENDTEEPSDDPTTGVVDDPTAFVVGGNDLGPPDIPTLSQWGSMLFAGLLSLLGLFGLRRFNG